MGKKGKPKLDLATADRSVAGRAMRMLRHLQEHYDYGRQYNDQKVSVSAVAEVRGVSQSTITKERKFASKYTQEQFTELAALRRPNGLPLHWGFIPYLLTIPATTTKERRARSVFQREIAKTTLSAQEVHRLIKQRFPRPATAERAKQGGRPRKEYESLDDLRAAVIVEVERARRGLETLAARISSSSQKNAQAKQELRTWAATIKRALQQVERSLK